MELKPYHTTTRIPDKDAFKQLSRTLTHKCYSQALRLLANVAPSNRDNEQERVIENVVGDVMRSFVGAE